MSKRQLQMYNAATFEPNSLLVYNITNFIVTIRNEVKSLKGFSFQISSNFQANIYSHTECLALGSGMFAYVNTLHSFEHCL